ncbi:MAG: DedA family protein [Bacteroidota bacterium]
MGYFIDLILHLDKHLAELAANYGTWMYGILFLIIFCETGLVVMPFLPGDSLLFATGALCAISELNVFYMFALLSVAAILGDTVNYWIGHNLGLKAFENMKFINKSHLEKTQKFYEKHGGKTIILARFIPLIRTFAPFVAGVGKMDYKKFIMFNVVGGISWIGIFLALGYFFGNLPIVKKYFTLVIVAIIIISLIPPVWEYIKHKREAKAAAKVGE